MPTPSIAELVEELFRTHRKPNGQEYRLAEISRALDHALEPSHLGKLRNGRILNPQYDTTVALCRFFEVPPGYFFPKLAPESGAAPADPIDELISRVKLRPEAKQALEELLRTLAGQTVAS